MELQLSFLQELYFCNHLTFHFDFCTLGCLDWPCLFETEISRHLAWDIILLTTFGVHFCGTDVSEVKHFQWDLVGFSGVLSKFGIDGSGFIASPDLVPNVIESFELSH